MLIRCSSVLRSAFVLLVGIAASGCGNSDERPAGGGDRDDAGTSNVDTSNGAADGGDVSDGGTSDASSDAAPPNRPPVVSNSTLDVELGGLVAGQLKASDPDGDPLTFAIASAPSQGTLATFDKATGLYTYRPTTTTAGVDSFTFHADDGRNPQAGPGTVQVNIAAFSLFRTWVVTDVLKSGQSCSNTELTLSRSGDVVTVSSRSYSCNATTTTLSSMSFDVVGSKLFRQGVEVGTLTAASFVVEQSAFVSGCGTVSSWVRIQPDVTGYGLEDGYSSGSCGSTSVTGKLHRGAHVAIVSSGDFGKVRYPGPAERTLYLGNDGDLPASAIAAAALAAPFAFKGGAWPGAGGTCGATLPAGEFCSVVVTAGATTGVFETPLSVSYSNGARTKSASLPLAIDLWRPATLDLTPGSADFGVHDRTLLPSTLTVTVTNGGTVPATSMNATLGAGAFGFAGGTYPGAGGTCGATLGSGATCTLALAFNASPKGRYASTLGLSYFDGEATVSRTLAVSGTAANFVGYGLLAAWNGYGQRDIVPYYDVGGWGPKVTSTNNSFKELAYDAASDMFFATNRHTAVWSITRAGVVTGIGPGLSWPKAAAVDPTRNRLVVLGVDAYASRDLTTNAWSTGPSSGWPLESMKYRAADDKFVALDLYYFKEGRGTYKTVSAATMAASAPVTIDFSGVKNLYFDEYADNTHVVSADAAGKIFIIGQAPWWKTGADAASGPFNTLKTAAYELDSATNRLSLAWEAPENAVQPNSATGLYGVGVYGGSCPTPPCTVDVNVNTGMNTVLLLTAYEAVNWHLVVAPGSAVAKVFVRSSHANTIDNPGNAAVDNKSSTLYASQNGIAAAQLRYQIENLAQLNMKTFQFAYEPASLTVTP